MILAALLLLARIDVAAFRKQASSPAFAERVALAAE